MPTDIDISAAIEDRLAEIEGRRSRATRWAVPVDVHEAVYDDAEDAINELPLSIETERHVIILLSTGGPAEWIDAELEADGAIRSAEFVAVWGSDRRVSRIDETDALWTLAEQYVESFGEG